MVLGQIRVWGREKGPVGWDCCLEHAPKNTESPLGGEVILSRHYQIEPGLRKGRGQVVRWPQPDSIPETRQSSSRLGNLLSLTPSPFLSGMPFSELDSGPFLAG